MKKGYKINKKTYQSIIKKIKENEDMTKEELIEIYTRALADMKTDLMMVMIENEEGLVGIDEVGYKKLIKSYEKTIERLQEDLYNITQNHKTKIYEARYYGTIYQAEQDLKMALSFSMLDMDKVRKIVEMPVGGLKLSERLYGRYRKEMAETLQEVLLEGYLNGYGYKKIAREMNNRVISKNYKNMERIVRTEGGRLNSLGFLDGVEELESLGIESSKQWLATLDGRTRDAHATLDGVIIGQDEAFEYGGFEAEAPRLFGSAALDINCRCDVINIVRDVKPEYRHDNIDKEIIDYVPFDEWLKDHQIDI